jgi:hypothetical protein
MLVLQQLAHLLVITDLKAYHFISSLRGVNAGLLGPPQMGHHAKLSFKARAVNPHKPSHSQC